MANYYDADLAYIHDTSYGSIAKNAALETLNMLGKKGIKKGLIVDLGCGSGISAKVVSDAGYYVLGIDYSEPMIAIAKAKIPTVKFIVGSFFDFDIPPCQSVISAGECLNYLFDDKSGEKGIEIIFRKVYNALTEGGIFLFDMLGPDAKEQQGFVEGEDWSIYVDIKINRTKNILTRDMTIFKKRGVLYARSKETHRQKLYAPEVIKTMLSNIGFKVTCKGEYAGETLRQGHLAYVAEKN